MSRKERELVEDEQAEEVRRRNTVPNALAKALEDISKRPINLASVNSIRDERKRS